MQFWKMHGLGNDYIVIDNRNGKINKKAPEIAKKLCDRRFSIGADGLLLVEDSLKADAKMRILNADGSEAEMCGNGIRCFSKYCYEKGIVRKTELAVETLAGVKSLWLTVEASEVKAVRVDMGTPNWDRESLPMVGQGTCINEVLRINGDVFKVTCLSVGNPHCVLFVESVDDFPVERVGPRIENHKSFPSRTNVGFVQTINANELRVRVWERGCGETLACGTGVTAAVAAANKLGKVGNKVIVHVLGGDLQVDISKSLFLSGPATKVFEGNLFQEV